MYNILQIGNLVFQTPQGEVTFKRDDKINTYETEAGTTRVELIKQRIKSGTISFGGLLVEDIDTYAAALSTVTEIIIFNPMTNDTKTFNALITNQQCRKIEHNANFSAWSFSFDFKEI